MKLKKIFSVTILASAVIGMSQSILAVNYDPEDTSKAESQATITVTEADAGYEPGVPDPDNPDNEIPVFPDGPNEGDGLLRLNYVSNFDFDDLAITTDASQVYAKADSVRTEDTDLPETPRKKVAPFVSVEDRRTGDEAGGWRLMVRQSGFIHEENKSELKGASLILAKVQGDSSLNISDKAKGDEGVSIPVGKEEVAVPIVSADIENSFGKYSIAFGELDDNKDKTNGVILDIPKNTPIIEGKYSATIYWDLSATPTD
ncbi:WxL domain-containing protein [Enterococcus mundtii]|uniref:WxL domain-containing protein n=1 Tax=Enterococcus mundtii TaxID=53346 RepID=A0A242KUQ5_ENTMU|nr:WxL domain-containing protein [Enterococcus mundtii]OTP24879.1 hypothetical protein A5802_003034 [Enterococcus mundtii]